MKTRNRFDCAATAPAPKTFEGTLRFDSKNNKDAKGYLRATAVVSATGVLEYKKSDPGGERNELVDKNTLEEKAFLDSLKNIPVTEHHPYENGQYVMLDSRNTSRFDRGTSYGEPRLFDEDGETFVEIPILIKDHNTVSHMDSGYLVNVSLGYDAKAVPHTGEYKGKKFDYVQRNREGNHIALVSSARAGEKVRVRFDSRRFDHAENSGATGNITKPKEKRITMEIDGLNVDVPDTNQEKIVKNALTNRDNKVIEIQGRFDTQATELTTTKNKLVEVEKELGDLKKVDHVAVAKARLQLEDEATKVLGTTAKFDGKTDTDIQKEVIAKLDTTAKFDGTEEPAEIRGIYKAQIKAVKTTTDGQTWSVQGGGDQTPNIQQHYDNSSNIAAFHGQGPAKKIEADVNALFDDMAGIGGKK